MSQADAITIIQEGIKTIIIVSAPILAVSLIVGLIISIFQATTQINEQTLSFAPKIIAIFLSIINSISSQFLLCFFIRSGKF